MTPAALRAELATLGLSGRGFALRIETLAREPMSPRTVQHWLAGERSIPAIVPALLALLPRADKPPQNSADAAATLPGAPGHRADG